jgi:hypothetical protein
MRSRSARLTLGVAAWIALAAAAVFIFQTEQRSAARRADARVFETRARAATAALADARAAQQAYVAEGQGVAFWMPKVADLAARAAQVVDEMRAGAIGGDARARLMEASAHLTEFGNVDRRAREYLESGDSLMAGDVVFSEGSARAAAATQLVEQAASSERQAVDRADADQRLLESYAAVGAGIVAALAIVLLAASPAPRRARSVAGADAAEPAADAPLRVTSPLALRTSSAGAGESEVAGSGLATRADTLMRPAALPRGSAPVLKAASDLCTEFAKAGDLDDLTRLLGRAADVMDASGLIVWVGDTEGADLRPALAHGYSSATLTRFPALPRSGENAASTAYRTGALQVVPAPAGAARGAVAAPLIGPAGSFGALTAEIADGSESSDAVQSLAALFAAQLAGALAASVTCASDAQAQPQTSNERAASA